MDVITTAELVSYLRDPAVGESEVELVVSLANGLISDEFENEPPVAWPTWVKILALGIAEAGWVKFTEESIDDWSGKRAAALSAMVLDEASRNKLAVLDGRSGSATAYTVPMTSPWDVV